MKNRKPLKNHDKWSFHFNKKTYRLHRSNIRVDEKTVSSKNDSKSQTSDRKIDALRSSFLSAFFCTLQHSLDGHDLLTTCCQHSISSTVSTFWSAAWARGGGMFCWKTSDPNHLARPPSTTCSFWPNDSCRLPPPPTSMSYPRLLTPGADSIASVIWQRSTLSMSATKASADSKTQHLIKYFC